ncbi:hypothetical protein [Actinomadura parmotrematis]|uniref:Uncharacterized protein n=1 Tax=Actinomadura parmotrematis TaxID=2864039 RepID=A0ABS7FWS6_9ACTN|nr:hypothetical protein [Actinomadura parmotrematis]MBW8484879.1 hypothetical protein [Actinomadura parmotrematis]
MNVEKATEACLRFLHAGSIAPEATAEDDFGFLPLAMDIDGDVAVIMLMATGADVPEDHLTVEEWTFHRRHGGDWIPLGSYGGLALPAALTRRPAAELGGRHLRRDCYGRSVRNGDRLLPWGAKYVSEARLTVAAETARLRVGKRTLDVPEHGQAVVVWGARRGPVIEALNADGAVLDKLDLS